jgi:two-component system sensor histidine kinase KdpD
MADPHRGKLKIYMGYAADVGKTYHMLEDAQELKSQGVDLIVGYFELSAISNRMAARTP